MTSPTDGPDDEPYVALTEAAVQRLKSLIEQPGPPVAGIRLQIARRTVAITIQRLDTALCQVMHGFFT